MKYIYDVLVNFKYPLYDFFEWNSNDMLIHIRKTPVFRIDNRDLQVMKNSCFRASVDFLLQIKSKTDVFKIKQNNLVYTCIFVSDDDVSCFNFDEQGLVIGKSMLMVDEEDEVLEFATVLDLTDISYEVISSDKKELYLTRHEMELKKYFISEIKELIKKKKIDKMKYLYYECFNKQPLNDNVGKLLLKEIECNWDFIKNPIHEFLKLSQTPK